MAIKKVSEKIKNDVVDLIGKEDDIKQFIQNADKTPEEQIPEKSVSTKRDYLNMTIRFNETEAAALDKLKTKKGLTRIGAIRFAITETLEREFGYAYIKDTD
jgi:hypothetical protein